MRNGRSRRAGVFYLREICKKERREEKEGFTADEKADYIYAKLCKKERRADVEGSDSRWVGCFFLRE